MIVRLTKKQLAAMKFGPGALAARDALQRNLDQARRAGALHDIGLWERELASITKFIARIGLAA